MSSELNPVGAHWTHDHRQPRIQCDSSCVGFCSDASHCCRWTPSLWSLVRCQWKSPLEITLNLHSDGTSYIHSCSRILLKLILLFGSILSISLIKLQASCEILSFSVYRPSLISWCNSFMSPPLKGTVPYNIAYKTTKWSGWLTSTTPCVSLLTTVPIVV